MIEIRAALDHYNQIYDSLEAMRIVDGTIVVVNNTGLNLCLYTIGNTHHKCPELLVFCAPWAVERYSQNLRNISRFMQTTGAIPTPHRLLTIQQCHFYPIEVDHRFISEYAKMALVHYNHSSRLSMLQLLVHDYNGHYPYESCYDNNSFEQPILKYH